MPIFNGATVSKHEKKGFVCNSGVVTVDLEENDGKITLKTSIYDFIKDFRVGIVTTETLGLAFEPEQRFENPDGSDIVFDRDYLEEHRGIGTLPGPFARGKAETDIL